MIIIIYISNNLYIQSVVLFFLLISHSSYVSPRWRDVEKREGFPNNFLTQLLCTGWSVFVWDHLNGCCCHWCSLWSALLTFVCSDSWSESAVGQGPVSRTRAQWPASTSDHSTTITCLVNVQLWRHEILCLYETEISCLYFHMHKVYFSWTPSLL